MEGCTGQVLIVEDDEVWRTQLLEQLQELGLTVFAVATKEEAITLVDTYSFDLTIIDINLTNITGNRDGLHVVDYLESKGKATPVIVISGSTEEGWRALRDRQRLILAEIRKDEFDLEAFLALVKTVLPPPAA